MKTAGDAPISAIRFADRAPFHSEKTQSCWLPVDDALNLAKGLRAALDQTNAKHS